jgi:hypothetical protein
MYHLVILAGKAQRKGVVDVTPYILYRLRHKLINYLSFDHLITIPQNSTWPWNVGRPTRVKLEDNDCITIGDDIGDYEFRNLCEVSITSNLQRQVVIRRLEECTFTEIANELKIGRMKASRLWYQFISTFKEKYNV